MRLTFADTALGVVRAVKKSFLHSREVEGKLPHTQNVVQGCFRGGNKTLSLHFGDRGLGTIKDSNTNLRAMKSCVRNITTPQVL